MYLENVNARFDDKNLHNAFFGEVLNIKGSTINIYNKKETALKNKQEDEELKELEKLNQQVLKIKREKLKKEANITNKSGDNDESFMTPFEKRRMKYLKQSKASIKKKNMIQNIETFRQRLKRIKTDNDEDHWANSKLKFHIDSVNAFALSTVKEKVDEKNMNSQFQKLSGLN